MITLHPYQRKAMSAVTEAWKTNKSAIVVLPTGCGKTILFSSLLQDRRNDGRGIVLAHREELIFQASQKIQAVTSVAPDIEMGSYWADGGFRGWEAPWIVSSIQTQISGHGGVGRMHRFKPHAFGTLVVDECHHATAQSYRKVMAHYQQNTELKTLGVTATPNRADEAALGQIFETCAFEYRLDEAIDDGWLCPVQATTMPIEGLDIRSCRTTAGDLNGADLSAAMEQDKPLLALANGIWREARGRKTLVFAASVRHAERLCGIFNTDYKDGCAKFVHAKTPKWDRKMILDEYKRGEFQILTNCGIFLEGFDEPSIEVVCPKPTKSTPNFLQMLGRGTRTLPGILDSRTWDDDQRELGIDGEHECAGIRKKMIAESAKPFCEVLDVYCQTGRHQLITASDALGGQYTDDVIARAKELALSDATTGDPRKRLERAAAEIQAAAAVRLDRERIEVEARYRKKTSNIFTLDEIGPIYRLPSWGRQEPATDKQKGFLRHKGINADKMSKAQASAIIGRIQTKTGGEPASEKQRRCLKRSGFNGFFTNKQATAIIGVLSKNDWNWPADIPRPAASAERTK